MLWPGFKYPCEDDSEALISLKSGILTNEEILVSEELPCSVFFYVMRFT